ncbi:MAG: hypothetical protein ACXVRI_11505 [Gaiellaceae bacterium]
MRLLRPGAQGRAPLGIAAFMSIPLFFSSLMASTLALEKPRVVQWTSGGTLKTTWHDPATATEARIWLWALVPSLVLIAVGWIATRLPLGFYVSCVAAVVIAMAVVHKTATWERHHGQRFPNGVDLIPSSNQASNKFDRGFWEREARDTALSLQHWTIGVAIAAAAVMALLYIRRRFFSRAPVNTFGALEGVHATDATPPGLG